MEPTSKLLATLAVVLAGDAVAIWIAARVLMKETDVMNAARAAVYQLLLWIPLGFAVFILAIPVAAEVALPTTLAELDSFSGALLVMAFLSGMLGVKWSYERNLRAAVFTYGLALALQIAAYLVLFDRKPAIVRWLPSLDQLHFFAQ